MEDTTTKITTLAEAFDYVNSRYTFTDNHYPVLKKLEGYERTMFSLTHSLLHLQKSINQVRRREVNNASSKFDELYRMFYVKTIVNIIKLAEVAGFTRDEFTALQPVLNEDSVSWIVENMMQEVATDCEKCDHGAPFDIAKIKHSVAIAWEYLLGTTTITSNPSALSFTEAYAYIPFYMKSS